MMRLSLILASSIMALITASVASGQENRINFRCEFTSLCGNLNGPGCLDEPTQAFLLTFEKDKGFSAVMYNEVWASENVNFTTDRTDLTALTLSSATGEIELLTADPDWNFVLGIHYVGRGEGVKFETGSGQCKVIQ